MQEIEAANEVEENAVGVSPRQLFFRA